MFASVILFLLEAILWAAVSWVIYTVSRWLLTRGGKSVLEEGAVVYRLRSGMRLLCYGGFMLGVWLLRCAWLQRQDPTLCATEFALGLLALVAGTFVLSTRMVIDHTGLHYFRWPNRCTTITWESMDHYEVMKNNRAASNVYFVRSKTGPSIAITDTAHDVEDILTRVKEHASLPSQQYVRRKWYGG